MKKNIYKLLSLPALLLAPGLLAAGNPAQQSAADTAGYRDIYPDTWVATDAVGRTMPSYEEVGAVKNDQRRIVGIFYITWHTQGLAGLKRVCAAAEVPVFAIGGISEKNAPACIEAGASGVCMMSRFMTME